MITREQVVLEARTWLGTPFHHQGRLKNVGVDCIGIIICVANDLKLSDFKTTSYTRQPNGDMLRALLAQELIEIPIEEIQPADIALFRFENEPQHVGFITDIGLLHSYMQVKKCIETSLDEIWKSRMVSAFKFKEFV